MYLRFPASIIFRICTMNFSLSSLPIYRAQCHRGVQSNFVPRGGGEATYTLYHELTTRSAKRWARKQARGVVWTAEPTTGMLSQPPINFFRTRFYGKINYNSEVSWAGNATRITIWMTQVDCPIWKGKWWKWSFLFSTSRRWMPHTIENLNCENEI